MHFKADFNPQYFKHNHGIMFISRQLSLSNFAMYNNDFARNEILVYQ